MRSVTILAVVVGVLMVCACGGGPDAETKADGREMCDALLTLGFCPSLNQTRCQEAFAIVDKVCFTARITDNGLVPYCQEFEMLLPSDYESKVLGIWSRLADYVGCVDD